MWVLQIVGLVMASSGLGVVLSLFNVSPELSHSQLFIYLIVFIVSSVSFNFLRRNLR